MANWKSKADYPPVEGTSLHKWAAEFLSRNAEFIKEYDAAKIEQRNIDKKQFWSKSPLGVVLKKYGVDIPNIWGDSVSDSPLIFRRGPEWIKHISVESAGGIFSEQAVGSDFYIAHYDESVGALAFDLTQPIIPQLNRAKKILLDKQKSFEGKKNTVKKAIVKLYPFYLRVLDAYAAGAQSSKICEILSQDYSEGVNDDTLRNWKLRAEQLRDGGYLDIVACPNP